MSQSENISTQTEANQAPVWRVPELTTITVELTESGMNSMAPMEGSFYSPNVS